MPIEVKGELIGASCLLHHMVPSDRTQVTRRGSEHPRQLSCLSSPIALSKCQVPPRSVMLDGKLPSLCPELLLRIPNKHSQLQPLRGIPQFRNGVPEYPQFFRHAHNGHRVQNLVFFAALLAHFPSWLPSFLLLISRPLTKSTDPYKEALWNLALRQVGNEHYLILYRRCSYGNKWGTNQGEAQSLLHYCLRPENLDLTPCCSEIAKKPQFNSCTIPEVARQSLTCVVCIVALIGSVAICVATPRDRKAYRLLIN